LSGFEDCVQELIKWGSDVNATTLHGLPLNLAAQKERRHVISILIGARADQARAVTFAAENGESVERLSMLFDVPIIGAVAEVISSPNPLVEDAAEENQPPIFVTTEGREGTQEDSTHTGNESNNFEHLGIQENDGPTGNPKLSPSNWPKNRSVQPQESDGEGQKAIIGSEEGNPGRMGSLHPRSNLAGGIASMSLETSETEGAAINRLQQTRRNSLAQTSRSQDSRVAGFPNSRIDRTMNARTTLIRGERACLVLLRH
jgi:hypothetical protein